MVSGAAKVLAASFLHPDNGPSFTVRSDQQSTTTTAITSSTATTDPKVSSVIPQSNQQQTVPAAPHHHWETELSAKRERMTRMGFPEEMIAQALKSEETKLSQMTAKITSTAATAAASTSTPAVAVDDATTAEPIPRQNDRPTKQQGKGSTGSTSSVTVALQTLRNSIEDKRTRMKKMGFPDEVIKTALKNDEEKLTKMMNE